MSLVLFNSATFLVYNYDNLNSLVSTCSIVLTPEQYLEWNNNDTYIINLVATQLGYTILPPEPI